jgi:hypothetical protein
MTLTPVNKLISKLAARILLAVRRSSRFPKTIALRNASRQYQRFRSGMAMRRRPLLELFAEVTNDIGEIRLAGEKIQDSQGPTGRCYVLHIFFSNFSPLDSFRIAVWVSLRARIPLAVAR